MMKKEMAKHQERYTLLDELALGEEKEGNNHIMVMNQTNIDDVTTATTVTTTTYYHTQSTII
jgi:hypothetical protein